MHFRPRWIEQMTCSKPCRILYTANQQRGNQPRGFVANCDARRATRKREIEAICHDRWPELSVREIEIFNFAVQVGYRRGYGKGYHRGRMLEIRRRVDADEAA